MIVVTGGSKGIGRAIIEKFASEGYSIATCSRNAADLAELKATLEGKFQVGVYTQVADLFCFRRLCKKYWFTCRSACK